MFHALTACDTVSSFVGHKKMVWTIWNALPTLSCATSDTQQDVMHTIEMFSILLFGGQPHAQTLIRPDKTSSQRMLM